MISPHQRIAEGEQRFAAGDVAGARALFEEVASHSDHPDAHNNLAVIYLQSQDVPRAVSHLRRALTVEPTSTTALLNLCKLAEAGIEDTGVSDHLARFLTSIAPPADRSGTAGPLFDPARDPISEEALLHRLAGDPVCATIRSLYVIGAHLFQEGELLIKTFPNLQQLVLFEPQPKFYELLRRAVGTSRGVRVYPYAVADFDGPATFHVTNNEASSSLHAFGSHRELFPHVTEVGTIQVECRTLDTVIAEEGLMPPDALFIDVQGAEYRVISALSEAVKQHVRLVYTEASLDEVYEGARPLSDLRGLLEPDFTFQGFCPLAPHCPTHGNAMFLRGS